MSDSLRPHGQRKNSLGKNTGVGCHAPPPGDLPNPGIEPASLISLALAGRFFTSSTIYSSLNICIYICVCVYIYIYNTYIYIYLFSTLLSTTNLGLGNLPHTGLAAHQALLRWAVLPLVP